MSGGKRPNISRLEAGTHVPGILLLERLAESLQVKSSDLILTGIYKDITILIADRNPHVRTFLQCEMTAAGYRVQLADTAREVIKWAFHREPLDLVILDPDLPDADESHMLQHLLNRVPALPVVVHTYASEYGDGFKDMEALFFVEKKGSSVERLKQVVYDILVEPSCRG